MYRDDHVLVLSKPAGMLSTSHDREVSLTDWARKLDPRAAMVHPTSRLDRQVCGLVTFARSKAANAMLMDARRRGGYRRCYVALCTGSPDSAQGQWEWPIGLDPKQNNRRVVAGRAGLGSKTALTHYRCEATISGYSVLALYPRTGRTHQLRVHASHAGCAMLGDRMYGGAHEVIFGDGRVVAVERVMLQCVAVQIAMPHVTLTLSQDVATDMLELWQALGGVLDPTGFHIDAYRNNAFTQASS